jgi:hypothetical protein
MEVTKMLSSKIYKNSKIYKKLVTATAAAAIVAGALIMSSPGRAMADPYHDNGARHEVYEQHDNGRHLGWDQQGRDFVRNDVRYTVVCDRDGDDCRTVPVYVAPGWHVFAPGTWFRR